MNTLSSAARKPLFPRGPGLGLEYLLFAVLSIGLMVADGRGERFRPLREWTSVALRPLLWVTALPHATTQLGAQWRSRETLQAENGELRQRQFELDARLQRMQALEAENQRLHELLSSAVSLQSRVLIAEVLAVSQDAYRHQILLSKGERDGVYKGQAVVDADGVVGQVITVNPTTAVVLLITDPEHGVPVQLARTGLQTVALGRGDGQTLTLPYLPGNADVKVGDLLATSGLGGRFPPGYPVARLTQLRHPAGENFIEALAAPAAQLDHLAQVLLVWSDQPGGTLDPASISAQMAPPPPRHKAASGKHPPPAKP